MDGRLSSAVMTSELLNNFPVDPELLRQFREAVLPQLRETPELYYEYDVNRLEEDDLYAHKFLAHQGYLSKDVKTLMERSVKMVLENFKWRKEFGVQDIKREDLPDEFFDRKGCIVLKEDKEGREVVVIRVSQIRKTRPGEKEIGEKFLIYWMENIYQRNDYGITIIIDCTDAGLSNVNMDLVEFANFIFRHHYPCYLGHFLVFKMPWLFEAVWNLIKRFLPQTGIERIKFVDKKSILEYIDKDKLPEYLGGSDPSEFRYHESLKDTAVLFREKTESQLAHKLKTVSLNA